MPYFPPSKKCSLKYLFNIIEYLINLPNGLR